MADYSKMFTTDYGKLQNNLQRYTSTAEGIAGQQYNQGQSAMQKYGELAEAAIDPSAPNRLRQGFEGSLDQTRAMIPGMAFGGLPTGYTPQEQQGMRVATAAPIQASFSAAQADLANRATRTGNTTGYAPQAMQLAQMRGLTLAPALAGLQQQFGNARREDEGRNEQFRQSANGMMANTGLNVASQYGTGQARETGNVPGLFQFPVESQFSNYNQAAGNQLQGYGQQGQVTQEMLQKAMQPGFWKQAGLSVIGGLAKNINPFNPKG